MESDDGHGANLTEDWIVIDCVSEETDQPAFMVGGASILVVSTVRDAPGLIKIDNVNISGAIYTTHSQVTSAMSVGDDLLALGLGKLVCDAEIPQAILITGGCQNVNDDEADVVLAAAPTGTAA